MPPSSITRSQFVRSPPEHCTATRIIIVYTCLEVRTCGVQESFLRRGELRTVAPLPRVPRVAGLDEPLARPKRPVATQTGQHERQRGQTPPSSHPLLGPAPARLVRARLPAIRVVRTMVEEAFNAAQTRGVVDDSVRGTQAMVVAEPRRRQRSGLLANLAPTPAALRTHDRGPSRTLESRRHVLTERGDLRLFRHHRVMVVVVVSGRGRYGWCEADRSRRRLLQLLPRTRRRRPERRLDILVGEAVLLGSRDGERNRLRGPQRSQGRGQGRRDAHNRRPRSVRARHRWASMVSHVAVRRSAAEPGSTFRHRRQLQQKIHTVNSMQYCKRQQSDTTSSPEDHRLVGKIYSPYFQNYKCYRNFFLTKSLITEVLFI